MKKNGRQNENKNNLTIQTKGVHYVPRHEIPMDQMGPFNFFS